MKLSDFAISVFKNFSKINSGFVIRPGKIQTTMASDKSVLAEVELDDDFPETFGIYDLSQFLGNITALTNPDLAFDSNSVQMDDGVMRIKYYSCQPSLIISPPEGKKLALPDVDVSFDLTAGMLTKMLQLAVMNGLPNISILGKNGEIFLQTHERKNDSSNYASTKVGTYTGNDFLESFKVENLKMLDEKNDYLVEMKFGAFSKWTSKSNKLTYFVALEKKKV